MTTNIADKYADDRSGDGGPLWLGAAALRELLPPALCVRALETALAAAGAAAASGHRALGVDVAGGAFHVKVSLLAGARPVLVAKINANFPGNRERGLPTIQGVAALFDADDGRLLALLDSAELTARRTGAATAVAARLLARAEARRVLLCGCGRQARAQLEALQVVLPLERVSCFDLDPAAARRLAGVVADELGLAAEVVDDLAPAARAADVIVTCTTSRQPFLRREHVGAGTFVAAVGSDHPSKQELDPALLAVARLVVDSIDQAAECGELRHALAAGAVTRADVGTTLGELVATGRGGRRDAREITLFDSTGIALEDAAAALAAYDRARAAGYPAGAPAGG